mmetsp:Transcript_28107/g.46555  ORF Transcript_28107/g.46555 Transcript_28107/m.46555 type:complete len:276 (-) Transcript_28107:173-1000(-)
MRFVGTTTKVASIGRRRRCFVDFGNGIQTFLVSDGGITGSKGTIGFQMQIESFETFFVKDDIGSSSVGWLTFSRGRRRCSSLLWLWLLFGSTKPLVPSSTIVLFVFAVFAVFVVLVVAILFLLFFFLYRIASTTSPDTDIVSSLKEGVFSSSFLSFVSSFLLQDGIVRFVVVKAVPRRASHPGPALTFQQPQRQKPQSRQDDEKDAQSDHVFCDRHLLRPRPLHKHQQVVVVGDRIRIITVAVACHVVEHGAHPSKKGGRFIFRSNILRRRHDYD